MTLKATLMPKSPMFDGDGNLSIQWRIFYENLQKLEVLGVTAKLDTGTATNAQIAGKLNEIIQLLRDNKYIDSSTSSDP